MDECSIIHSGLLGEPERVQTVDRWIVVDRDRERERERERETETERDL